MCNHISLISSTYTWCFKLLITWFSDWPLCESYYSLDKCVGGVCIYILLFLDIVDFFSKKYFFGVKKSFFRLEKKFFKIKKSYIKRIWLRDMGLSWGEIVSYRPASRNRMAGFIGTCKAQVLEESSENSKKAIWSFIRIFFLLKLNKF
jgi:hypothetical protein